MTEIANPIPSGGINEKAVMIARRNSLMNELLRIAPALNPPEASKPYKSTGTAKTVSKRPEPKQMPKPKDFGLPQERVPKAKAQKPKTIQIKIENKPRENKVPKVEKITVEVPDGSDAFADNPNLHTVNGINLDIYDYFGINPERAEPMVINRLDYIQRWVSGKNSDFRKGLRQLNVIDNKLGSMDDGPSKVLKLYNYLRLHGNT